MAKRKAQKRPIVAAWNANRTRPCFEWKCPACGKTRHFFLAPTLKNPHIAKCINTAKHPRPILVPVRWPPPGDMVENELPNRQIAAIADQFRLLVFSMQNELGPTTPVAPLLMNASFCLELYLKCLNAKLVYHGAEFEDAGAFPFPTIAFGHRPTQLDAYEITSSPVKIGHDLVALLDAVPEIVRRELDRRFRRTNLNAKGKTFRTALAPYRTLFEEIRYVFEQPSYHRPLNRVSISELCKLVGFLFEFTQSRILKWSPHTQVWRARRGIGEIPPREFAMEFFGNGRQSVAESRTIDAGSVKRPAFVWEWILPAASLDSVTTAERC